MTPWPPDLFAALTGQVGTSPALRGNTQLVGKRLELLTEMLPALSRVAVFWDPFVRDQVEELKLAARSLGIQLLLIEAKTPGDFDEGFRAARQQKAGAVMLLGSPQVYVQQARLGELALENRLPTEATFHGATEAGGLVSYPRVSGQASIALHTLSIDSQRCQACRLAV